MQDKPGPMAPELEKVLKKLESAMLDRSPEEEELNEKKFRRMQERQTSSSSPSSATLLRNELDNTLHALTASGVSGSELREKMCIIVAKKVCDHFKKPVPPGFHEEIVKQCEDFGSRLVLKVAMQMLSEPPASNINNIVGLFISKVRNRANLVAPTQEIANG